MSLVIDTDIGTDVDDAFALAYAIKNNADIKAIIIVHGDTEIRAKIARKLERIFGANIPVIIGKSGPKKAQKYWLGFEKNALTPEELKEPLEKLAFPKYDENMKLVCLGPLTNIAYQLENNPSIKNVKEIYVMGYSRNAHNFKVDLKAAEKVLAQPWDVYIITKKVSKKIYFTRNDLEQFRGSELGNFLYDSAIRWLNCSKKRTSVMYDVLTVSAALQEGYVKFKKQTNNRFISYDVDLKLKDKIIETIGSAK